MNWIIYFRH